MSTGSRSTAPGEVPNCTLDAPQLGAQLERYRGLGQHATNVERLTGEVVVRFENNLPAGLLERTLDVERRCCPFVHTAYDPSDRRLTITVEKVEHDLALDSLFHALNRHAATTPSAEPKRAHRPSAPIRGRTHTDVHRPLPTGALTETEFRTILTDAGSDRIEIQQPTVYMSTPHPRSSARANQTPQPLWEWIGESATVFSY